MQASALLHEMKRIVKAAVLAANATGEYRAPSGAPGHREHWTGGRGWPRPGSETLGSRSCVPLAQKFRIVCLPAIGLPLANVDQTGNLAQEHRQGWDSSKSGGDSAVRDRRNQRSGES